MNLSFFLLQLQSTQSDATKKISENSVKFNQLDPIGIGMTLIGMAVVFASLILLYLLFLYITKLLLIREKRSRIAGQPKQSFKLKHRQKEQIIAALSFALHQHFEEIHDNESAILTINRVARTYSPWSSKIYMLRQLPR